MIRSIYSVVLVSRTSSRLTSPEVEEILSTEEVTEVSGGAVEPSGAELVSSAKRRTRLNLLDCSYQRGFVYFLSAFEADWTLFGDRDYV